MTPSIVPCSLKHHNTAVYKPDRHDTIVYGPERGNNTTVYNRTQHYCIQQNTTLLYTAKHNTAVNLNYSKIKVLCQIKIHARCEHRRAHLQIAQSTDRECLPERLTGAPFARDSSKNGLPHFCNSDTLFITSLGGTAKRTSRYVCHPRTFVGGDKTDLTCDKSHDYEPRLPFISMLTDDCLEHGDKQCLKGLFHRS